MHNTTSGPYFAAIDMILNPLMDHAAARAMRVCQLLGLILGKSRQGRSALSTEGRFMVGCRVGVGAVGAGCVGDPSGATGGRELGAPQSRILR
jgi:hypothetical protein